MKPWTDEVKEGVSTWMTGRPSFGTSGDVAISIDYSTTDATDPLAHLAPEPSDETTVPLITDPLQVGRVGRPRPDPRKKKRRRKMTQASKRRNRR